MKKVTFIMALAVGAGLASCTAQSPKANLKTDVDSLSYAIGMARTEGLHQVLSQTFCTSHRYGSYRRSDSVPDATRR